MLSVCTKTGDSESESEDSDSAASRSRLRSTRTWCTPTVTPAPGAHDGKEPEKMVEVKFINQCPSSEVQSCGGDKSTCLAV